VITAAQSYSSGFASQHPASSHLLRGGEGGGSGAQKRASASDRSTLKKKTTATLPVRRRWTVFPLVTWLKGKQSISCEQQRHTLMKKMLRDWLTLPDIVCCVWRSQTYCVVHHVVHYAPRHTVLMHHVVHYRDFLTSVDYRHVSDGERGILPVHETNQTEDGCQGTVMWTERTLMLLGCWDSSMVVLHLERVFTSGGKQNDNLKKRTIRWVEGWCTAHITITNHQMIVSNDLIIKSLILDFSSLSDYQRAW
jgi:hypothetical protein